MPTEYGSRNNKGMHTREVLRYNERGGDRFVGKRDWVRVASASNPGAEPTRAPLLSSFSGGSYEPPSKRRPSGRHGFSGENGRREHTRLPDHQPGMFNGSYSTFAHTTKVERYGPPPPPPPPGGGAAAAMSHHFSHHHHYPPASSTRNGLLRDSLPEDDYYRDREPEYQPLHGYSTFSDSGSSSFTESHHHRGSRYAWGGDREHHRERLSSSPDVFDRKVGISRYGGGGGGGAWGGGGEREIEGRHDRYGGGRDAGFGDLRGSSLDLPEEFVEPGSGSSRLRGSSLPREEPMSASPRKKTRLTWGDGLASYEQKHVPKVVVKQEEEPVLSYSEREKEKEPVLSTPPVADSNGDVKDVKLEEENIVDSPPVREPTPMRDVPPAAVDAIEPTEDVAMEASDSAPAEPVDQPAPVSSPGVVLESSQQGMCHGSSQESAGILVESEAPPAPPAAAGDDAGDQVMEVSTVVKVTKEELLLQVEQVEFEIDSIEKELARLAVEVDADDHHQSPEKNQQQQQQQLEPEVQPELQPELQPEHQQLPVPEKDEHHSESTDSMAEEHEDTLALPEAQPHLWEITEKMTLEFAHLLPESLRGKRRVYKNPQESPVWVRNEELHQVNKSRILERMMQKRAASKLQEKSLVLKYRLLKEFSRNESPRSKPRLLNGESSLDDPQLMKRILSEPLCTYRDSLRMPSMILNPTERTVQHIITSNRLVEDPISCELERKAINPWTPEERKIFVEKFGVFYKNFAKIASFLPHKTTGDCVEFYYKSQKSEDLIKLRKKQKKRHYRTSYLATTTAATGGRFRDSNAAAIHKLASAASLAAAGRLSRNQHHHHQQQQQHHQQQQMKAGDRERLSFNSECVTGNFSSIVTGICSLSSDAPMTPSRASCERGFDHQCTKQKGARSCRGRREHAADEVELEWSDGERELFLDALLMFGKDFRSIALHLRSRSESQCKTFFSKARKRLKLDRIVEQHKARVAPLEKAAAAVNRACDDPAAPPVAAAGEDRLGNARSVDSEDMEVSVVVDSGLKELSNEGGDRESHLEGMSAAPVDSPVSSVITSPGLVSSSSPAIQATGSLSNGALENKPLTEIADAVRSRKRKLEEAESVWSLEKLNSLPVHASGILQSLYGGSPVAAPPVVLSEQQQMMILQHHKQLQQQQGLQFLPQGLPGLQFPVVVKQENHQRLQQQHLYTNTQKLLFQQGFLQQDHQAQKHDQVQQQQHLLNLLTQQQQLALQLHQPQIAGSFSAQQQKVPGLQLLEAAAAAAGGGGAAGGGVNKFLTGEFGGKPPITCDEQRGGSDVKLFGKSLLSSPAGVKSLNSIDSSGKPGMQQFLLGESWCSGSAEAQDRGINGVFAANAGNGQNGGYSGGLPEASSKVGVVAGSSSSSSSCSREALNLWKMELMKSGSFQHQQQQQQQQQQHQMIQQQQQQQGLMKDGVIFQGPVIQFGNGVGWGNSSAGGSSAQQARLVAQLTMAEQQRQSLS